MILTVLWAAVGMILFAVIWAIVRGESEATGGLFGIGLVMFIVVGALFANEVQAAFAAANVRLDDCVRHDVVQDARLDGHDRVLNIPPGGTDPHHWSHIPRPEAPR
jgi:hypothetical protein